ncbi:MAG TPA: hypothetical protein PLG25_02345 [bacterium]|nr:hypothetical protein [bacterium]HMW31928.1 hypothetical protein [bacterium]HMY34518.1 hypothetical protein [bacterium]HMZ03790.1 hypothetical protein [bacterium]HNB07936.1 hypothetical protein [bacterium]
MNEWLKNKKFIVKALGALILVLLTVHLIISITRVSKQEDPFAYIKEEPVAEQVIPEPRRLTIGVSLEQLNRYVPFDEAIDSLLTHEFDIQPGFIKSERIQLENVNYIRKVIQLPKNFPNTLFVLDMNVLSEQRDWDIFSVSEKLNRQAGASDFTMDIGRRNLIYSRLEFTVNPRLRPMGKEVFFVVTGFGKNFDDLTRSFVELPESFAILVPKTESNYKIIAHEAERTGKSVMTYMPWSKYIYYFDEKGGDQERLTQALYENLEKAANRAFIVCEYSSATYQVLKKELPRLAKKGYIPRTYIQKW